MLAVILVISAALVLFYKFYAEEKIENTLEKAQTVMNNQELQAEIDEMVGKMVADGEVEETQVQEYMEYKDALEQKPVATPSANAAKATQRLMDRVRKAMTADEFAYAMYIYGKIDVKYVASNIVKNREEVKKYVKSVLTSEEISKCLTIYKKYSYLLK